MGLWTDFLNNFLPKMACCCKNLCKFDKLTF